MSPGEVVLLALVGLAVIGLLYLIGLMVAAIYNTADKALSLLRAVSMNVNRLRQMSELQQPRVQVMGLGEMINHVLGDIDNNNARETRAPRRGPRTRSDARAAANAA